ncbi:MAG: MarR family winged helix-turn-helix transcriptional regulator [Tabrizicola sp.]
MAEIVEALATRLGFLTLRLHRRVKREADRLLADLDLATGQMGVLEALRAEPGLSQIELGEMLEIDRTSIGVTVAKLEAAGLVARSADATDGRAYVLALTAEGQRLAAEASEKARAAQALVLQALTEAEQETLIRLLRKVALPGR